MMFNSPKGQSLLVLTVLALMLAACDSKIVQNLTERASEHNVETHELDEAIRTEIPDLPFPENPDPSLCGIPTMWGNANNQAWLTGYYDGKLVQPTVYLYNSHARTEIVTQAAHGTEVEIIMFQANPVLDYYYVKIVNGEPGQDEGWIPEPFLSFEPVND